VRFRKAASDSWCSHIVQILVAAFAVATAPTVTATTNTAAADVNYHFLTKEPFLCYLTKWTIYLQVKAAKHRCKSSLQLFLVNAF
jgi:hypothetical protein